MSDERYRAKIFRNGGSQAIRLPKECRFPDEADEVVVRREGDRIVLEYADAWPQDFLDLIGKLDEDLPRSAQTPVTKLRDPFEGVKG